MGSLCINARQMAGAKAYFEIATNIRSQSYNEISYEE